MYMPDTGYANWPVDSTLFDFVTVKEGDEEFYEGY